MLATFLIGLREGLEAGLVVGILVAYLGKLGRRDLLGRLWVGIGLAIGVSLVFGAILTWGPYALTFEAQEILGGGLSLVAVALVTWMIFWMASHGAGLSRELRSQVDSAIDRSWIALVVLGAVSVGREGIETALFVWATVAGGADPVLGTLGAVLGILTAVVIAYGISKGLVRFNLSVFFTWTGLFLIFVAAGVLSYGIGDLQEANVLPGWGVAAFSLAAVIMPGGWIDVLLGGMFNFTPEPTWLQFGAWLAYLVITIPLYLALLRRRTSGGRGAPGEAGRVSRPSPELDSAPAAPTRSPDAAVVETSGGRPSSRSARSGTVAAEAVPSGGRGAPGEAERVSRPPVESTPTSTRSPT